MKNVFQYIVLSSILLSFSSCDSGVLPSDNDLFLVEAYSPVYPILVGKDHNPTIRIAIQPKTEENAQLQEVHISLKGTQEVAEIKSASLFSTKGEADFSTKHLFAQTSDIGEEITLTGEQALADSSNYFWLSLTLNDQVDIDHTIQVAVSRIVVNGLNVSVDAGNNASKRLGHALRQHGDDGVDTYRIPGLATSNEGTLLAVYDVRRAKGVDLQEDIDVGLSRSTDGGQSWEPMQIIMDMGEWGGLSQKENGIGDPSILVDKQTNTIWVAGLWIHGHIDQRAWFASQTGMSPQETGQLVLVKSEDDGLTWSAPINITNQVKDPKWFLLLDGPGKGISMEDGTLVFPAQFKDENQVPHSTLIYSKDHGKNWTIGTGAKSKTTEAQLVELSDHSIMLNMRDDRGSGPDGRNGTGARSVAVTKDLGQTWLEHPSSRKALSEPVCMASLIKHQYQDQELLLFSNPDDQYIRQHITIKVSQDEGMNWDEKYYTLIDEGRGRGYSCLTTIDENTLGLIYEGSQSDLVFQRIKLSEIMTNKK